MADQARSAASDHYYRVYVCGYVFPKLPEGSTNEQIREAVENEVETGCLDITKTTVEAEWTE